MGWFTDLTIDILDKTVGATKRAYDESQAHREQERIQREWEERERRRKEKEERDRERRERERERAREQAEREKTMRLSTLKSDIEAAARELSNYKRSTVNPQLTNSALINQSAMRVSESSMNDDVQNGIRSRIARDESNETSSLRNEIELIDDILRKISQIERENVA